MTTAPADPGATYRKLLEAYLVTLHCELSTPHIAAGFRIGIMELHAQGLVSGEAARETVRRVWRNRGAGSRNPRCAREGRAAAHLLRGVLAGDR